MDCDKTVPAVEDAQEGEQVCEEQRDAYDSQSVAYQLPLNRDEAAVEDEVEEDRFDDSTNFEGTCDERRDVLNVEDSLLICSQPSHPRDELDLDALIGKEEQQFKELAFVKGYSSSDKRPVYVITQRKLFNYPPFGYTSRISITLKGSDYVINSLGFHVESGTITSASDLHELCQGFAGHFSYKFCPGIDWKMYQENYYEVIRYHLKSVRYTTFPIQRVDSVSCPLWFKQPAKARASEKYATEAMCSACKRLLSYLNRQLQRTTAESPSRKVKRQAPSSKAKLSNMSPASQLKRKQNVTSERNNDRKKLRKYENTEVTLADEQHDDMCNIVNAIEEVSKEDLEKVFAEGDMHGVGDKVREIWLTDRRQQLEQFHEDQARNGK